MSQPNSTPGSHEPAEAVLSLVGVSKAFGPIRALSHVNLEVRAGEVVALLGENGAGKSTLLKILAGEHSPDGGQMLLEGSPASFASAAQSRAAGIRLVYQEPEIVPHVSVAENVYLGHVGSGRRRFDRRALERRVEADIERLGFTGVLHASTLGSELSPAQRQVVEILKALVDDVRVIAFDEPTSSLSAHEDTILFDLIRTLRDEGVGIVYVSHRMNEIFTLADRVVVLRDGRSVGARNISETDKDELITMMVGRELGARRRRATHHDQRIVLEVSHLSNEDVHDVSLTVHAGEVVALAGLVGAGRTELAHAVVGDTAAHTGRVLVDGIEVDLSSPSRTVAAGIGLVPEERKEQGMLLHSSIKHNITLAVLRSASRFRFVRRAEEAAIAQAQFDRLRVRAPSIETTVDTLSGGNQQKVVLARWLARRPKVLILDEPTRGIDVGAKAEIYEVIDELAQLGIAILVISSELPEVLALADRVIVMFEGRITGELPGDEATEERLLTLAMPPHSPTQ